MRYAGPMPCHAFEARQVKQPKLHTLSVIVVVARRESMVERIVDPLRSAEEDRKGNSGPYGPMSHDAQRHPEPFLGMAQRRTYPQCMDVRRPSGGGRSAWAAKKAAGHVHGHLRTFKMMNQTVLLERR